MTQTTINALVERLRSDPASIQFAEVIETIDENFDHTPTAFTNGNAENSAEQNQGSAKVLSFARIVGLSESETLACFAEHYRSILSAPEGEDHQNIRQFMLHGWAGVALPEDVLQSKR